MYNEDLRFLIRHVISRNHVIKESRGFIVGSSHSHDPVTFGGYKYCKSEDLMFVAWYHVS